jgi:hypothetical protein
MLAACLGAEATSQDSICAEDDSGPGKYSRTVEQIIF